MATIDMDGDPPHRSSSKPNLTSLTNGQSAMSYALQGLTDGQRTRRDGSWTPDTLSDMSDPDGAGLLKPQSTEVLSGNQSSRTTAVSSDVDSFGALDNEKGQEEGSGKRRKSVQVVIEESAKRGKYTITTKDPVLQEIMQSAMQRKTEQPGGKRNHRFRELRFTKQFTTFDRQNPSASQSPFHGFFTLFWIAMVLLLVRIAAWNIRTQGSIFGKAEILHLMVDRDLFAMLATDASMCAASSFGFFLHLAIAGGYLTWNGSGWIIQSVWQTFFTGIIIWITFWRDWPWTHTVFIVLHVFVLLMKQHSYSFYNGYCELLLNPSIYPS